MVRSAGAAYRMNLTPAEVHFFKFAPHSAAVYDHSSDAGDVKQGNNWYML